MNVETSKKILKIFGIIDIVLGAFALLGGFAAMAGGGVAATQGELAEAAGLAMIAGVIAIIAGILSLIEGIFCVRAAKDSSKIMPAWIFAIISVVFAVISLITSISGGGSQVVSNLISLAINALVFWAANTIKKEG